MTARRAAAGFTLFEMIMSIAIIGILTAVFAPGLLNPTDVRLLDAEARGVMSSLQSAKWQAAAAKINHRVRFFSQSGRWWYVIEAETAGGVWSGKTGQPARSLASKFALSLTLPADASVSFAPTGFVANYNSARSQIALSSAKLKTLGQPDRRLIQVFASGSFRLSEASGA